MLMKKILILFILIVVAGQLSAQTPVESVVMEYQDASGSRKFIAQGMRMSLARSLLKSTPVGPIANDVDKLYILKMEGTPQSVCHAFVTDLDKALESYEYYGKQPSSNGEVSVYVHYSAQETIDELVIYNPAIYSLNCFYGRFTPQQLRALAK